MPRDLGVSSAAWPGGGRSAKPAPERCNAGAGLGLGYSVSQKAALGTRRRHRAADPRASDSAPASVLPGAVPKTTRACGISSACSATSARAPGTGLGCTSGDMALAHRMRCRPAASSARRRPSRILSVRCSPRSSFTGRFPCTTPRTPSTRARDTLHARPDHLPLPSTRPAGAPTDPHGLVDDGGEDKSPRCRRTLSSSCRTGGGHHSLSCR